MMSVENKWSILNTFLLVTLTVMGALIGHTWNQIDNKMEKLEKAVTAINERLSGLENSQQFEKGRIQGLREALEAQRRAREEQ